MDGLVRLASEDAREAQAFADHLRHCYLSDPMPLELEIPLARTQMLARAEPISPSFSVLVEDRVFDTDTGSLKTRVFLPETIRGVYLHFHGGGWCIGSSRTQDGRLGALAEATELAVVSLDYRLAPEHPFPAAVQDCVACLLWALHDAHKEFGSPVLLVGGESAGAHLAALSVINLRDHNVQTERIRGVNLAFGIFDLGLSPSQRLHGMERLGLTTSLLEHFYSLLLPEREREDRRSPDISPLYADLRCLPPALFTVGQRDLLLDDTLFMWVRWQAAGNQATLRVYPEALHGFLAHPIAVSRLANRQIHTWLQQRILLSAS
jgi:acetyl esterase